MRGRARIRKQWDGEASGIIGFHPRRLLRGDRINLHYGVDSPEQRHLMRLSAIRLAGFKSFVDPTHLKLDSNLTAVVGPNGCGKSNIIDAVRWVMGESSARQLRGDAMEDVIFNGSKGRKPVGRASVELVFDNSEGRLEGQFGQYAEISVKRELARDGQSTYFLNGKRCRRRDVSDLFLGTGLGSRNSYAIIQQGTVSRLVEARPEDMRNIIEEAAGISRYKERRRETENRIRHTRDNLDRLDDLRSELGERLAQLKRQADNAERYKLLKTEERKVGAELVVLRLQALEVESREQEARIESARSAYEAARAEADAGNKSAEEARADQQVATDALQAAQGAFYGAESALSQLDQAIRHARELAEIRRREQAQLAGELDRLEAEQKTAGDARQTLERELADARAQLAQATESEDRLADQAARAEEELSRVQSGWDQIVEQAQKPLRDAERERVRVEHAERQLEDYARRADRLRARLAELDIEAAERKAAASTQQHAKRVQEQEAARAQVTELDVRLGELRLRRSESDRALDEARKVLHRLRGQRTSLEALQKAALQQDEARMGGWLQQHGLAEQPRLAQLLQVEPGHETAVEAVLGPWLQAVAAASAPELEDAPPAALGLVSDSPSGALPVPATVAGARPLISLVEGPAVLMALLDDVYYTDDPATAAHRADQLKPGQRLVTSDGSIYGPGYRWYASAGSAGESVIARERTLKQLHQDVSAAEAEEQQHRQALETARTELSALDARRSELVSAADQVSRQAARALAEQERDQSQLEQSRRQREAGDTELKELTAAQAKAREELDAARATLSKLMEQAAQAEQRRNALQAELTQARQAMAEVRHQLDQARRSRQDAAMQLSQRETRLGAARQRVDELVARRRELDARLRAEDARADRSEKPIETLEAERGPAEAHKQAAEADLRKARERLQTAEVRVRERADLARKATSKLEPLRERLQQAKLDAQGLQVRRQTLVERLQEMNATLSTVRAGLPEDATVDAWVEQLASLERRIQRLGAINLAAIEEYAEQQARAEYLDAQHKDLTDALEQLTSAINQIDRETRARFRETFETVNGHFQTRFPMLFGGGEATLELTGDDLLETGIRVMARPPGKRNASIQLLSGGEKAMTAVALLFALFQLTPAPFCMLDEVDAPLDDANVSRYCDMIRHMSEDVQFIIISHNKLTMELADRLHGVTMQEPGVSRLVSVDMEQALEMAG